MNKNYFFGIMFLILSFAGYSQAQKVGIVQDTDQHKDPLALFNSKRSHLPANQFQDLYFHSAKSDNDIGAIADCLDKLDNKIVKLIYVPGQNRLRVFYSIDVKVLDIMQTLKSIGFPAYYLAANGDQAFINEYGQIELIQMNK